MPWTARAAPAAAGMTEAQWIARSSPTLPPIKTGGNPFAIAITPDGKTAYVSLVTAGVVPIRTATNTALPGLKIGYSGPIAITP